MRTEERRLIKEKIEYLANRMIKRKNVISRGLYKDLCLKDGFKFSFNEFKCICREVI